MDSIIYIKSISQLMHAMGLSKPKHPLVGVVNLSEVSTQEAMSKVKIVNELYGITIKTKSISKVKYGRSVLDFDEGCLLGIAPGQAFEIEQENKKGGLAGWAIYFHSDFLENHPLADKITSYGFFDYQTNEALHLSEKEQNSLIEILDKIEEEYDNNIDQFSREVILSNIDLLLSYIKRYYNRQFLTRNSANNDLLGKFEKLLKDYFNNHDIQKKGLPSVQYFSNHLNLSASYLSDLLKKETGKNAQEHIHFQLIRKAKFLLLNSNATVAEVAYQLGFEHPPYFSRLFKKKMGITPTQFRTTMN
ncbi:helix-turn-helix domain-containing protein [Tenacibaculum sp. Ill]|uniref:helix-turn-helix domain-containing protein n=1 Tax=Tenacibaculum sp. Ill TaxID=3445935 RepID=UPI003F7B3075